MKITAKSPRTKNYTAELRRPFAAFILNPNFTNKMLQLIITKKPSPTKCHGIFKMHLLFFQ